MENILIWVLKMKKTKLRKIIEERDFTQNRKMDFLKIMIFILSGTKKSLQSALFAFNSYFKFKNDTYSKQAFSKA